MIEWRCCSRFLLAAGAAAVLLAAGLRGAEAANDDWKSLHKQFRDTWEIGDLERPGRRETSRGKKLEAVCLLGRSHDGRAVPVLLAAHRSQLKFIEKLRTAWEKRKRAHDKLAPSMERALRAKVPRPDGQIQVTPAEREWIDEKERIEKLYVEITDEEGIAETTRAAMGQVLNETEGKEHGIALKHVLKGAGRGQSPDEREFIRLLGYVKGEDATAALRRYAQDLQPLVAQAALEALGRQNDPSSVDLLIGRLEDPRWQVRVSALLGLSFFREERVVDVLLERADRESGVLRGHFLRALARIVGIEEGGLPPTVEAWRKWWRENRERVLDAWCSEDRIGPVEENLPPVRLGADEGGHTYFYGIRTDSKHIIFVIDVSGSMGEHGGRNERGLMRIDVVKRELKNAIRSLSASESDERGASTFNIVVYAADVRVYKKGKMIVATKGNKEKAFKWIDDLEAIGATNIFDAIEQAFLIVDTRRVSKQLAKGADTIFLMTDGKPNRGKIVDPDVIRQEVTKMNRERRITLHAVGVGPDHNAVFLEALALENGGQYLAR